MWRRLLCPPMFRLVTALLVAAVVLLLGSVASAEARICPNTYRGDVISASGVGAQRLAMWCGPGPCVTGATAWSTVGYFGSNVAIAAPPSKDLRSDVGAETARPFASMPTCPVKSVRARGEFATGCLDSLAASLAVRRPSTLQPSAPGERREAGQQAGDERAPDDLSQFAWRSSRCAVRATRHDP
jgi:hypothetical protein